MSDLVVFDFRGDALDVLRDESGQLWVSARAVCDALGVDADSQRRRLADADRAPWATTAIMTAVANDGKLREIFCVSRKSLPMWLATMDASRVSEASREKLKAYQRECADALDAYFDSGVAINHRRLPESVSDTVLRHKGVVEIALLARDYLSSEYIERTAVHSIALVQGTAPEPAADPLIDVTEYLVARGLARDEVRKHVGQFGKKVKAFYERKHGRSPKQLRRFINGAERLVNSYTESDRSFFDAAFESVVRPKLGNAKVIPIKGAGA